MARAIAPDEILRIVAEEDLLQEPPVYARVQVRGPIALVWWGLRVYVLIMAVLIAVGFARGLR